MTKSEELQNPRTKKWARLAAIALIVVAWAAVITAYVNSAIGTAEPHKRYDHSYGPEPCWPERAGLRPTNAEVATCNDWPVK